MTVGTAADWLRAWDSQGHHRTGGDGDEAGAAWLAREAESLGAMVTSEAFALDRIDPVEACLELDGERIEGVPVFDAPPTGPDGVSGTLGPAGGDAAIGVAALAWVGPVLQLERLRGAQRDCLSGSLARCVPILDRWRQRT